MSLDITSNRASRVGAVWVQADPLEGLCNVSTCEAQSAFIARLCTPDPTHHPDIPTICIPATHKTGRQHEDNINTIVNTIINITEMSGLNSTSRWSCETHWAEPEKRHCLPLTVHGEERYQRQRG